ARHERRAHEAPELVEPLLRDVREPEGEEHEIEAPGRPPPEDVGADELGVARVENERLGVRVDGDDAIRPADELPRPDPRAGGELEDTASLCELLERRVGLGDIRFPAGERVRLELVAPAPVPPVVVLLGALGVVAFLPAKKVAHAATASSRNRSTPTRESAYRGARGSGRRTSTAGIPSASAPSTSATTLSPTIHASAGASGSSTEANACGGHRPNPAPPH